VGKQLIDFLVDTEANYLVLNSKFTPLSNTTITIMGITGKTPKQLILHSLDYKLKKKKV
jgi:hypothetical protein